MQERKKWGEDPFVGQAQDDLVIKPLEMKLPDVHETMRIAGAQDVVLTTERSRGQDAKRRIVLCCCGQRGCGIGPMTTVVEE